MFKRAVIALITSIALSSTMVLLLYGGFSSTLAISSILTLFGIAQSPLILDAGIILFVTALISYLLFCAARLIFSKAIHSIASFAEQVWGLTACYNIVLVFISFYFAGAAGLYLFFYFCVIYLLIGVFTLIDFCICRIPSKSRGDGRE